MTRAVVSLEDVAKDYTLGNSIVHGLRGVTLEVHAGEFVSIAGPSGSGKTTLLNLIGCVDVPTRGRIAVAGRITRDLSQRELARLRLQTIGFVFQSFNLVPVLDVYENVELPLLLLARASGRERRKRTLGLLERVGLLAHAKHRPRELSGGQRQRVAIARALVARPQIVLADEPTANLDSATGRTTLELMKEINREEGTTFVFSTHDAQVMAFATTCVRLVDGELAEDAAPAEAYPLPSVTGSR